MIRFMPDTWRDALLRPIAMAAPDAGVYVEISAPDLRFAVIIVLGLFAIVASRRSKWTLTPLSALLLWLAAAFAAWLATSGNGRYFIPGLLLAGPACIGLVTLLRGTASLRLLVAVGVVALQGWVIFLNDPWRSWSLGVWDSRPFFDVQIDEQARLQPATYITIANISYSLIAPRFHAGSKWVNISSLPDAAHPSADGQRLRLLLARSADLKVLVPTRPDHMTADGLPTGELQRVINDILVGQRLVLAAPLKCRVLPSPGLAGTAVNRETADTELVAKFGFWICDLRYPVAEPARRQGSDPAVNAIFELIENQCPRFYQPGQKSAVRIDRGWMRVYPQADIRLYVMDDGTVHYKYWRALNPAQVGTIGELKAGVQVGCKAIRGRSGLPWEREI